MLRGCISAIVTPMFADGQIDFESLDRLVEWQIASGVAGLVVAGSTGEALSLTNAQRIQLIQAVVLLNAGRVKIIVGSGASSTWQTLEFIELVNHLAGVDYLMSLTPYYVRPSQEGLYQHFAQIAQHSKFPVILYNVPSRTGCDLSDQTALRLAADFQNIIGLKDASGDIQRCLYLLAHKAEHFQLFSGDDASALAFMLCGGDGVISVVSNIRPLLFSQMASAALDGKRAEALRINRQLLPLYTLLFSESNPIPLKWSLFHEGRIQTPHLRLPLTELQTSYHRELAECLHNIKGTI